MVIIEVPSNENCEAVDLRVYHDLEPAWPVSALYLEREPGKPVWYQVTGWTLEGTACPAQAQKIDDSGDGVAILIHGGEAGLRLQPLDAGMPWSLVVL